MQLLYPIEDVEQPTGTSTGGQKQISPNNEFLVDVST